MKLVCVHCGRSMETFDITPLGRVLRCPVHGTAFVSYRAEDRADLESREKSQPVGRVRIGSGEIVLDPVEGLGDGLVGCRFA